MKSCLAYYLTLANPVGIFHTAIGVNKNNPEPELEQALQNCIESDSFHFRYKTHHHRRVKRHCSFCHAHKKHSISFCRILSTKRCKICNELGHTAKHCCHWLWKELRTCLFANFNPMRWLYLSCEKAIKGQNIDWLNIVLECHQLEPNDCVFAVHHCVSISQIRDRRKRDQIMHMIFPLASGECLEEFFIRLCNQALDMLRLNEMNTKRGKAADIRHMMLACVAYGVDCKAISKFRQLRKEGKRRNNRFFRIEWLFRTLMERELRSFFIDDIRGGR